MKEEILWFETQEEVEKFDKLTYREQLNFLRKKFNYDYRDFFVNQINQRNKFIAVRLYF